MDVNGEYSLSKLYSNTVNKLLSLHKWRDDVNIDKSKFKVTWLIRFYLIVDTNQFSEACVIIKIDLY